MITLLPSYGHEPGAQHTHTYVSGLVKESQRTVGSLAGLITVETVLSALYLSHDAGEEG